MPAALAEVTVGLAGDPGLLDGDRHYLDPRLVEQ